MTTSGKDSQLMTELMEKCRMTVKHVHNTVTTSCIVMLLNTICTFIIDHRQHGSEDECPEVKRCVSGIGALIELY